MMYIDMERSPADFVFQVFRVCGTRAPVVKVAATRPRMVKGSAIAYSFEGLAFSNSRY